MLSLLIILILLNVYQILFVLVAIYLILLLIRSQKTYIKVIRLICSFGIVLISIFKIILEHSICIFNLSSFIIVILWIIIVAYNLKQLKNNL